MKEGKRFIDTKPEDISGRFLHLTSASASARVTLLTFSHFAQTIGFTEIYSFPSTTRKTFSQLSYQYVYIYLYVRAGETEDIDVRRNEKWYNMIYS